MLRLISTALDPRSAPRSAPPVMLPFRPALPALVLMLTAATAMAQFTPTVVVGGRQVTLFWSSPFPGATEVAWGSSSAPAFAGYPNRFTGPGTGSAHSATLRRLAPGTWYLRARTASTESMEVQVVVPPGDGAPLADWAFDGTVNALLRHGSSWYIGGTFSSVGQTTGGGVPTLFDGGLLPQFPEVAGQVFAVEPDGLGGFYVGGSFTSVGGLPRSNVAHLLPSLGVDPQWNPDCNGPVYAMQTTSTGSIYLGGAFTAVSGQPRGPLVELAPNGVPTTWNPSVNGLVFALEQVGSTLYLGGTFTAVNGQNRRGLAAVDTSGALQSWNPALTGGFVAGLMALGGVMYVHGTFSGIGVQSRAGLAAVDFSGTVLAWNPPTTGGQVSAFAPNGTSSLFLGGSFTSVGPLNRPALALVDTDGGQPLSWNAGISSGQVVGLANEGGGVSAVGSFTRTATGLRMATFSTSSGAPVSSGPRFNGIPRVVARSPNVVFVGGDFTGLTEQPRSRLAAINTAGVLEAFAPVVTGGTFGTSVNALAGQGSNLVVGGNFSQVNGTTRNNVAMLSTSGLVNFAWNPNVDGEVRAVALAPGVVLLGGLFTQVNGALRGNGAIVDVVTGQAAGFNPGFNSGVFGIATDDTTSYWVGGFGASNGVQRGHAAAFTLPSGTLDAWSPFVTTEVKAVHVVGDKVVLGGSFNFVNSFIDRSSIAVFDRDGGGVTPFDAHLAGVGVYALTSVGNTLFAGGENLTDAGLLIAVDLPSSTIGRLQVRGQTDLFFSTKVGSVESLAPDCAGQRVAVGGFFHSSGLTPVGGLTLIEAPCDAGVDAGLTNADAGTFDAGVFDAGVVTDAGMGVLDAGAVPDAGDVLDAGVAPDAGPPVDGGSPLDAGEPDGGPSGDAGAAPDAGAGERDAGRDAGAPDGGGMVLDAGDGADAGVDGGRDLDFVPVSCGCSGVDQAPLGLGLLLVLLLRRRAS